MGNGQRGAFHREESELVLRHGHLKARERRVACDSSRLPATLVVVSVRIRDPFSLSRRRPQSASDGNRRLRRKPDGR